MTNLFYSLHFDVFTVLASLSVGVLNIDVCEDTGAKRAILFVSLSI